VGRKAHNGRALSLAELTCRAAHIVALGCWADNHGAASGRGGVLRGGAGQHNNNRARILAGQIIRVV
jgi:hypothetical protein